MSTVPERSELAEEHKWALDSIFESDEAWADHFETISGRIDELTAYEGRVTESPETLFELLALREEIMREVSQLGVYANLRASEDTRNQEYQALSGKAQALSSEASSAVSYIEPELQELTEDDIEAFVGAEPELAAYEQFFDDVLRAKPHTRSAEVEELLAELGEVTSSPSDIYSMLANADMTFPTVEDPDGEEIEISQGNFTKLLKHEDRSFRKQVHEEYYDEWADVRNAVGTSLKKQVRKDVKVARARNYETAREAALDGPNVPVEVYDTLVDTVRENLDTLHRHADLKREAIDGDDLRMWDLYVPLVQEESPEVPYEEACEYVVDAVAPLGEDYQSRLAEGLDSRWVDVYETKGKQSGAYSGGTYDSQPYILMNYQDDVESMYTLAHELGHSLHSQFTSEEQPYVYSDYEIFVAEVASTVNETLLTHHLLETVEDERLRRHVLNQYLERFRSTLYRQTMFAEFEHRAHELSESGEALTPDRLDELYLDLKSDYYEPAAVDDRIAREWMRIPHFYRAFYVYQYATGISAALAIVDDVLARGQPAAEDYLEFLKRGSREYPLELLRIAGVDMSSSAPIDRALETYGERLDEFESLLG